MTLKPCPNPACRSNEVRMHEKFIACDSCGTGGPDLDPTGEKWNNMLRVEDVEDAFSEAVESGGLSVSSWASSDTKRDLDRRMGK